MLDLFVPYSNIIGITGVALTLTGYYLLNINKLKPTSMIYLILNFSGSCLVLFSLMFHWNLSSVIIETAWISISLIGMYRVVRSRGQKKTKPNNLYVIGANRNKYAEENV